MAISLGTAALIGGGLAAAGSIGGAAISAFGSKGDGIPSKRLAANQSTQYMHQQAALEKANLYNEIGKERIVRAEKAKTGLWGNLGAPGTYEDSYEDFYGGIEGGGLAKPGKLFKKISKSATVHSEGLFGADRPEYGVPESITVTAEGKVIKPNKYIDYVQKTRQGRLVSYLTAEADQLVRQEGPLWESISQSVNGPIIEGAASIYREAAEELSRNVARGGTARNRAVNDAHRMRMAESVARDKQNALWQSNLALIEYGRNRAVDQLAFNTAWVNELPGVRDMFNNMMMNAEQFYGQVIAPAYIQASQSYVDGTLRHAALTAQTNNTSRS